jgi:hypothetical protein
VHDVRVLRGVLHNPSAALLEALQPPGLHRSDELDDGQRLVAIAGALRRERRAVATRVELRRRQRHLPHVVATVGARSPEPLVIAADRLDERELLIAGDDVRVRAPERRPPLEAVRHDEQVGATVRRRGLRIRQRATDHEGGEQHSQ